MSASKQANNQIVEQNEEINLGVTAETKETKRLIAIDRFRGIAIFCMIFFQILKNFDSLPFLSRIAQHNLTKAILLFPTLAIADLIASMFFFAIGLSYKLSYDKRVALYGKDATRKHFVLRFLMLMGIAGLLSSINVILEGNATRLIDFIYITLAFSGLILFLIKTFIGKSERCARSKKTIADISKYAFLSLGVLIIFAHIRDFSVLSNDMTAEKMSYWTVLQAIAMAGLFAIPFLDLDLKKRVISMCVLMLVYMVYHQAGNEALIDAFVQGGIVGSVGFTFTIILGTIFVELYQTRRKEYYFWTFALLVPTAIFYYFFPVSFGSVSPSYLLIGVQASALLFFVVNLFNSVRFSFDPLAWWGRYPILLYLLEFFVVGGILEIAFPKEWFSASASPVIPLVFAGTIVVAFTVLVYFLNRKNRRIVVE